jgi:hypothetical protein
LPVPLAGYLRRVLTIYGARTQSAPKSQTRTLAVTRRSLVPFSLAHQVWDTVEMLQILNAMTLLALIQTLTHAALQMKTVDIINVEIILGRSTF